MLKAKRKLTTAIAIITVICQILTFVPIIAFANTQQANGVEVNSTNFTDENFRNWILNPKNLNGFGSDGILTDDEIQNITEIDVKEQNISSLKGIEFFTSLERLTCTRNNLTSLDVSSNTALTALYCSNNLLKELDVSNNPNLEFLYCASNFITDLNLQGTVKLRALNCERNRLEQIDLSDNPELVSIYTRHNQLTQLDVSNNTKLVFIETFDNQLTSFDPTMLTELEFLHIDYNNLTTLDMSKNPKLKDSGFVAANNQLKTLVLPDIEDFEVDAKVFHEQNPKEGYGNIEWYHDSSFTQKIEPDDLLQANGQTIYAKWIANPYTVYYNANGGSGKMESQKTEYGQTFNLLPNAFSKIGYTFKNWNTYSNAIGGRTFSDGQEVSNLAGKNTNSTSVTLYAQWEANRYTINYDPNGGNGNMDSTSAVYDKTSALAENKFTKDDHVFIGWSTRSGDNEREFFPGENVKNLTSENNGTVTLYAVWMSNEKIQQIYKDQLDDFFSQYSENDYFSEDFNALEAIKAAAVSEISGAGSDESVMSQALNNAISAAQKIMNKQDRALEIAAKWQSENQDIINKLSAPVSIENIDVYKQQISKALSNADKAWLSAQSTMTEELDKNSAAETAQKMI